MISTRTKAMKHWKEQRKTGVHGGKESKTCCTADSLREMHFILLLGILMTLVLFCCSGRTSRRVVWSIIVIVILFICTVVLAIVDSSSCELIVLRGSIVWSLGNQKYVVQNFVFFVRLAVHILSIILILIHIFYIYYWDWSIFPCFAQNAKILQFYSWSWIL